MRIWLLSGLIAAGILSGGCIQPQNGSFGDGASLADQKGVAVYDDIPVMPGLEYRPQKSFIYDSTGRRICDLKYTGRVEFLSAFRYYKEQMPVNGWDYTNSIGSDPITLEFTKGPERAKLVVAGEGRETVVTIQIGERSTPAGTGGNKH